MRDGNPIEEPRFEDAEPPLESISDEERAGQSATEQRVPDSGMTDDAMVAAEEGVPWDPPTDRVLSESRLEQSGPDQAGAPASDAQELERDASIQQELREEPTDDELLTRVLETLRASDLVAGDQIQVAVDGRTVIIEGEVESVSVADEIAALAETVTGVDEIRDQTRVTGL